jgi:bZIP transcription factor
MSSRLERDTAQSRDQAEEAQASTAPFENLCSGSSLASDLRPLRPEAAALATIAPRLPYWPQGAATPAAMFADMSNTSFQHLPVQMPTFGAAGRHPAAALAEFALAAAPAWALQPHHEQDSAAVSMAQVRASASTSATESASEQDIALRHSDHIKPAAAPVIKTEWSATPLKGDSKPIISKKERNRISAHNSRVRKQEYLQQLEHEVAAYRAAAHREVELLNEQWTALNSFLRWFCTSDTCSQEQWGTFADENCVLWLPLGDVASNEAAAVAAQHNNTVVCFTGVAEIASHGRQHFFDSGATSDTAVAAAAAAAAAATAVTGGVSSQTSAMMDVDSQNGALSGLHIVVDRQQMYTRCSSTTADSGSSSSNVSNLSYVSAHFMCSRHVTYTSAVHGAAACTFAADCNSGQQRLISVNLLYDTCAMARLLAATTRYHARSSYTTSSTDICTSMSWSY